MPQQKMMTLLRVTRLFQLPEVYSTRLEQGRATRLPQQFVNRHIYDIKGSSILVGNPIHTFGSLLEGADDADHDGQRVARR
jgi:hypothetical protein